jgi:hypothetical protein
MFNYYNPSPVTCSISELTYETTNPHRKVSTYTGQDNKEKYGNASMSRDGFEPTIPVLKQAKPTP